jgi:hypothetical protein
VTRAAGATRYAAALVSAALLVAGCGGSKRASKSDGVASAATQTATPTATPSDAEQIQSLLKERARRIQNGDALALVETSTGPQAVRDKREANAARALKLEGVTLESRAASIQGRYATAHVVTRYHFLGIDDSEFAVRSAMSFTKTPDGWRVKDDHPSQGVVAPWQLTNYIVRRSPHFVTLAPVGLKLDNFMKDLEAGRAITKRGLPDTKVPERLLVLLARNTRDAKALARDAKSIGSIYAIAQASVQQTGPAQRVFRVSAQRMLVMWRWLRRSSQAERRMTIAHEMTHAALVKQTSGRMPAWLVEGTAMYVSGDRRYSQAGALLSGGVLRDSSQQTASKRVLSLTALGKPTSLDNLATTPLGFAYSYASAAAYAIAQKHGRKGLLRLYKAFDKQKYKGTPGRKLMDRVLRATLHQSLASLQQDVDAFARAHAKFG